MPSVSQALALLQPFDVNKPKVRLGPTTDGGYVFIDELFSEQTILSYGISTEYRFDAMMAEAGHVVHMFDHTIEGINATNSRMLFHREGIAESTNASDSLYGLNDHLEKYAIEGDDLILKMDVEGHEFAAIRGASEQSLRRFAQIVIEVHGLQQLGDLAYRAAFVSCFKKLNKFFTLHHVHGNNYDGPDNIPVVQGVPVCSVIELSYVRSNLVTRYPSKTLYPTHYDYPNCGGRDKLLWFYPFIPSDVEDARYDEVLKRNNILGRLVPGCAAED